MQYLGVKTFPSRKETFVQLWPRMVHTEAILNTMCSFKKVFPSNLKEIKLETLYLKQWGYK